VYGAALAVALAALAIQAPIYDRWLAWFDEGFIYQIASELAAGAVMYRDVAHIAFPGVFELMAGVFSLTGPSALAGRTIAVGLFTTTALLTLALARTVLPLAWAALAAALFVLHRPWAFPQWQMLHYSTLAVTLLAGAAWLLARALPAPSRRDLIGVGAALGAAILAKQDYGLAVTGATHLFLLVAGAPTLRAGGRLRALVALDTGISIVLAPVAAYFAWHGALDDLVAQTIVAPLLVKQLWRPAAGEYITFFGVRPLLHQNPVLHSAQAFNYFPPLLLDLHLGPVLGSWWFRETIVADVALKLAFLGPGLLIVANALSLAARRERRDAGWWRECWITVFAAGLLAAFNKPRDWAHLVPVAYPACVLGPLVVARAWAAGGWRRYVVVPPAAIAAVAGGAAGLVLLRDLCQRYDTTLGSSRARLRVEASEAAVFRNLDAALAARAPSGAPVPVYPYHPSINFVLGRPGIGRFRTIEPVAGSTERDAEVVSALDQARPFAVVVSLKEAISQPPFAVYAKPIYDYLRERYQLGPVFSCAGHRCIIGMLTPRPPATERVVTDLAAALDGAVVTSRTGVATHELVGEGRRATTSAADDWPYLTSVLALRPLEGADTRVEFALPPVPTRFRARAGVNPARWAEFEPGTTELGVSRIDAHGETVLWHSTFDPERRYDDRTWRDVDVPLPSGPDARLVLWVRSDRVGGYPLEHAGFEQPRLLAAPGPP